MRRTVVLLVVALMAIGLMAAPALAMGRPDSLPADGQCVSNGVKTLGGSGLGLISTAATGGLAGYTGEKNSVPIVIKDHLFNGADVTEAVAADLLQVAFVTVCD